MAQKKVNDISAPSESKPDIGSKPMIVGHKSLAADPMVREKSTADESQTKDAPQSVEVKVQAPSATKKIIEPTPQDAQSDAKETTMSSDVSSEKNSSEQLKEPSDNDSDATEKKVDIDPVAAALEKEESIRKIVESKKYRVSIKQARGSSSSSKNGIIALIALVIMGVGALFYLVDTNKLDVGFKLPFSVLGEEESSQNQRSLSNTAEQEPEKNSNEIDQIMKATDISARTEYAFDTPENWTFERNVQTSNGLSTFVDTYTLPSGTVVVVKKDFGGRGGFCEPAEGDVPHRSGNACPTIEYLQKDELEISDTTVSRLSNADNPAIYLTKRKFTTTNGLSSFEMCLETFNFLPEPEVDTPLMGAYFDSCLVGISLKEYELVVSVENLDPNNQFQSTGFVDNDDISIVENALLTFEVL